MRARPKNQPPLPSVFKSPAARNLAIAGSVIGCGVGAFAGVCGSFGSPSNFVRNTLIGGATGITTFGMFGFFTGAAATAVARTKMVTSVTHTATKVFKGLGK